MNEVFGKSVKVKYENLYFSFTHESKINYM